MPYQGGFERLLLMALWVHEPFAYREPRLASDTAEEDRSTLSRQTSDTVRCTVRFEETLMKVRPVLQRIKAWITQKEPPRGPGPGGGPFNESYNQARHQADMQGFRDSSGFGL